MLLQVKDLDRKMIKVTPANKNFACITVEIGYGRSYLGNSSGARSLLAREYTRYHYDELLASLPKMLN
jgi:hypothetical protein